MLPRLEHKPPGSGSFDIFQSSQAHCIISELSLWARAGFTSVQMSTDS